VQAGSVRLEANYKHDDPPAAASLFDPGCSRVYIDNGRRDPLLCLAQLDRRLGAGTAGRISCPRSPSKSRS
jgi:hypothetical protein